MSGADIRTESRLAETRRVTIAGAIVNVVLCALKAVAGIFGGSSAMLADAVHSLSDLFGDGVVLVSGRLAAKPADDDHPYGHGRLETMGTVLLTVIILGAAGGIAIDAIERFTTGEVPSSFGLWVAGASVGSKEVLYHLTVRVGRRHRSQLVLANAWHHRSDALSSVTAFLGILGARMGFPILDPVAAIVVAALIAGTGVRFARDAYHELTDRIPSPELLDEIADGLGELPGVQGVHQLRARRMGSDIVVDLHVEVASATTVSDGHQVAERVRRYILRHDSVTDVMVHIDPEPDEPEDESIVHRPREEIERDARELARRVGGVEHVSHVLVHYLGGRVTLQMHIGVDAAMHVREATEIALALRRRVEAADGVDHAKVYLELEGRASSRESERMGA